MIDVPSSTSGRLVFALDILQDLADDDPCAYDGRGYCQAHGWPRRDPACPIARARELLDETGHR